MASGGEVWTSCDGRRVRVWDFRQWKFLEGWVICWVEDEKQPCTYVMYVCMYRTAAVQDTELVPAENGLEDTDVHWPWTFMQYIHVHTRDHERA